MVLSQPDSPGKVGEKGERGIEDASVCRACGATTEVESAPRNATPAGTPLDQLSDWTVLEIGVLLTMDLRAIYGASVLSHQPMHGLT